MLKFCVFQLEGGGHVEKSWPRQRPGGGAMSKMSGREAAGGGGAMSEFLKISKKNPPPLTY